MSVILFIHLRLITSCYVVVAPETMTLKALFEYFHTMVSVASADCTHSAADNTRVLFKNLRDMTTQCVTSSYFPFVMFLQSASHFRKDKCRLKIHKMYAQNRISRYFVSLRFASVLCNSIGDSCINNEFKFVRVCNSGIFQAWYKYMDVSVYKQLHNTRHQIHGQIFCSFQLQILNI